AAEPRRLCVRCGNGACPFGEDGLPLVGVDEEIYRRLPGFVIATVDKFAALPWEGRAGTLFGLVDRKDADGFYGPCDEGYGRPLPEKRLPPPDLIIQDELHLISGPLGTMVGLYEAAIEELCLREDAEGHVVRPKIVASTATVRRAEHQIEGLFGRSGVTIFPPPGPNRRDSFFAVTQDAKVVPARRYIGISARGRSFKVVQLRVGIALLAAAAKLHERHAGPGFNPADPYMTLLAYFSSLRELGGARRIYEDEVKKRVAAYRSRAKNQGQHQPFQDRQLGEIAELTSRVSTSEIAEAKDRLSREFTADHGVDVALATNMIAVGLDITRLGLMIVTGQPISTSEYIQATSRVGRDVKRPGLVVTLFNPMRPRDRSHYERFAHFHQTYYRQVETTSVTPFSLRALDRGLAGALVGLVRHSEPGFAKPDGFKRAKHASGRLHKYARKLSRRAGEANAKEIEARIIDLLDDWDDLATEHQEANLFYNQAEARGGSVLGVLHEPTELPPEGLNQQKGKKFRAQRSLRDVESVTNVWLKVIGQRDYLEEDHG
ncbi:MAG: helicase-related protein, partial [Candidatus Sericytochromatia bacterium]